MRCWAFHGCNNEALESIINNPLSGFQPLASGLEAFSASNVRAGSRSTTLWGSGTYFAREPNQKDLKGLLLEHGTQARDAKYVADGGFCGNPDMNGSRRTPRV